MGWRQAAVVANLVIIEGPHGGLFIYNGTPGPNNLAASGTAQSGTDRFGNQYLAGFTTYVLFSGLYYAVQHSGYNFSWFRGGASQSVAYGPVAEMNLGAIGDGAYVNMAPGIGLFNGVKQRALWITPSGDTTGAIDTSAIQSAIDAGARVVLTPGTFFINQPIAWDADNVSLQGSGYGFGTTLHCAFTSPQQAMIIAGNSKVVQYADIRNLYLAGNSNANSGHGILYRGEVGTIQNVQVQKVSGDGFHCSAGDLVAAPVDSLVMINCYADRPAGNGLWTDSWQTSSEFVACHFAGGLAGSPGGTHGIFAQGGNLKFIACHPFLFANGGAVFTGNKTQVIGGEYETNPASGIAFIGANGGIVKGTIHYGNTGGQEILVSSSSTGIIIDGAQFYSTGVTVAAVVGDGTVSHCKVVNCDAPSGKGINFTAGANFQIISLNDLRGAAITHSGANDIVANNL